MENVRFLTESDVTNVDAAKVAARIEVYQQPVWTYQTLSGGRYRQQLGPTEDRQDQAPPLHHLPDQSLIVFNFPINCRCISI